MERKVTFHEIWVTLRRKLSTNDRGNELNLLYTTVFGPNGVLMKNLHRQSSTDGYFPSGHNGPYGHQETPVRNTAHWVVSLSTMLRHSSEPRLNDALSAAVEYLLSEKHRPGGYTFHCRDAPGRDKTNGVIGQAWVMEALIHASRTIARPELLDLALQLYFMHPWNPRAAAWEVRELWGETGRLDTTFNHQLWFASISSMLGDDEVDRHVEAFISTHVDKLQTYRDGVIYHLGGQFPAASSSKYSTRLVPAVNLFRHVARRSLKRKFRLKSSAYHAFNLMALLNLSSNMPFLDYWKSANFASLLRPLTSQNFAAEISESPYGFEYNLAGYESAIVAYKFGLSNANVKYWQKAQEAVTPLSRDFGLSTGDRWTCLARLYELSYLNLNPPAVHFLSNRT